MCDVLSVSDQELTALKSLISSSDLSVGSLSSQKREPRVTFNENTSSGSSLADFLACFDFGKKAETSVAPNAVAVKKLPPAKMNLLGTFITFQSISIVFACSCLFFETDHWFCLQLSFFFKEFYTMMCRWKCGKQRQHAVAFFHQIFFCLLCTFGSSEMLEKP